MADILESPENSLISQSKAAREGLHGINADGFGVAWFDQSFDQEAGAFKSIQPAWNDSNLRHLIRKIRSSCFIGHVRACTVGDVAFANCHPFTYRQCALAHNGTIREFSNLRRQLLNELNDDIFENVKGNTDSEHFFALIMQYYYGQPEKLSLQQAAVKAFNTIEGWQAKQPDSYFSHINMVLTDGNQMIATRYTSKGEHQISLYYAHGHSLDHTDDPALLVDGEESNVFIVASEPLTDYAGEWHEFPQNHLLHIDHRLKPEFIALCALSG